MQYIRIKEVNEWEGATWYFYVPFKLHYLKRLVEMSLIDRQLTDENPYTFDMMLISDKRKKELQSTGEENYHKQHTFFDDCEFDFSDEAIKNCTNPNDPLYKGGIKDFIVS